MLVLMTAADLARYDDVRVSQLLEAAPEVLPLLLRHGFEPLRSAVMRAALAPTVTLAQAVRLRGLSKVAALELRRELVELLPPPRSDRASDDDAVGVAAAPARADSCP
jgi:hypothetical protein